MTDVHYLKLSIGSDKTIHLEDVDGFALNVLVLNNDLGAKNQSDLAKMKKLGESIPSLRLTSFRDQRVGEEEA